MDAGGGRAHCVKGNTLYARWELALVVRRDCAVAATNAARPPRPPASIPKGISIAIKRSIKPSCCDVGAGGGGRAPTGGDDSVYLTTKNDDLKTKQVGG